MVMVQFHTVRVNVRSTSIIIIIILIITIIIHRFITLT